MTSLKFSEKSAFKKYSKSYHYNHALFLLKRDCHTLKEYYQIYGKPNYKVLKYIPLEFKLSFLK